MDVSNFTSDLLSELANLDFVEHIELETEAKTRKEICFNCQI